MYAFAPIWPSLATLARSVAVDASLIMDWLAGRYRAAAARGSTAAVMSPATDGDNYDVIVLGGGAPGEHCAAALAARGLRVAVVERELVGGECSYWACIPSKSLLRPGEAVQAAREAGASAQDRR